MMIELDMAYDSLFGDFLSQGSRESFDQIILFRLSPPRKATWPPRKAARQSKKQRCWQESCEARPMQRRAGLAPQEYWFEEDLQWSKLATGKRNRIHV